MSVPSSGREPNSRMGLGSGGLHGNREFGENGMPPLSIWCHIPKSPGVPKRAFRGKGLPEFFAGRTMPESGVPRSASFGGSAADSALDPPVYRTGWTRPRVDADGPHEV